MVVKAKQSKQTKMVVSYVSNEWESPLLDER